MHTCKINGRDRIGRKRGVFIGIAVTAAFAVVQAFGEPSGDRPDATHAWSVHDPNRPNSVKVDVPANGIPSDAIVLFDGTADSITRNWRGKDGGPCKWIEKNGEFICTPGSRNACTKEEFGDCQIHVEFKTPTDDLEGWGNSGVMMMDAYEIQILDSFDIKPNRSPWKPANYADGQAGAVYGQHPPIVNPCRKTGEWQSYDIIFHPPYREGGRLVDPGSVTVLFNGVLIQDGWPFEGKTGWCRRAGQHPEKSTGPLALQDHGHPVSFRNIWIRRIPSRFAETECGGPGVKYGDVAALRHRLAGESLGFAKTTDDPGEKFIRLWESYCYEPDRKVKAMIPAAEAACISAIKANDERICSLRRIGAMRRFVKMLVASGWMEKGSEIEKALNAYKAPPKPTAPHLRDI